MTKQPGLRLERFKLTNENGLEVGRLFTTCLTAYEAVNGLIQGVLAILANSLPLATYTCL